MRFTLCCLSLFLLAVSPVMAATPAGLDIHFIDTEGGAATLIVTPAGESILIDCGNPGSRDAERIHKVTEKAGLKKIDHLVITHWHGDHYGGVDRLTKLIPVSNFYDHGINEEIPEVKQAKAMIQAYKDSSAGKSKTLKPGDEIKLVQTEGKPPLSLRCICGDGKVIADKPNAPENPIAKDHKAKPEDKSDNARSLGFVLSYGDFRFLDLGDLTWNIEHLLVSPSDKIGLIEVYQATHHGLEVSNNPVLINTVKPRVAIFNNGPRKGAHPSVIGTLRRVEGIQAIYQVHKNIGATDAENTDADFIANKSDKCEGESIHLATAADGKTYSVTVGGGKAKEYKTRGVK
ncbi:MAG: MBL fold metallo-hydrolase [Planctomycetes bacterium]|nr:MBL fold metallo-hydrolase [Planctomycetota bacterium]